MIRRRIAVAGAAVCAALLAAVPVSAEVVPTEHGGFASSQSVVVPYARELVWQELIRPDLWWTHTWSGEPANLSLDLHAGGCFCERVPVDSSWEEGSVEHARVVAVTPQQSLRMTGALGPLQSEGLNGTLTVTLEDVGENGGEGTRIVWDYVVGGSARYDPADYAPVVDRVQVEFLASLVSWMERAARGDA